MTEIEYKFVYNGATEDECASMEELLKKYFESCKKERTLENLKVAYGQSLINLIRLMSLDIANYLHERGFHDTITQQKILGAFNDHVNYNLKSILDGITFEYGAVDVRGDELHVNFKSDMDALNEYFAEVHAIAINAAIKELADTIDQYAQRDLKALEELYELSKAWSAEEYSDKLAEYCTKCDTQLLEKYGAIIFNFRQFGFNSEKFREMVVYLFYNLSMPYSEILMRYFKRSLKKDSAYQKNLGQIRYFITRFNAEIAKQKQEQAQHQNAIKEGANQMYAGIN